MDARFKNVQVNNTLTANKLQVGTIISEKLKVTDLSLNNVAVLDEEQVNNIIDTTLATQISSGTFTPTVSNVESFDEIEVRNMFYTRIGNIVNFSFSIRVLYTGTINRLQTDLPIPSNFNSIYDIQGVIQTEIDSNVGLFNIESSLLANTINNTLYVQIILGLPANYYDTLYISGHYIINE